MNMLILLVVAVVAFCYFGGNYCPAVLRKNKEMLLGVVIGIALCSFMGFRIEGCETTDECNTACVGGIFDETEGKQVAGDGTGVTIDDMCSEGVEGATILLRNNTCLSRPQPPIVPIIQVPTKIN